MRWITRRKTWAVIFRIEGDLILTSPSDSHACTASAATSGVLPLRLAGLGKQAGLGDLVDLVAEEPALQGGSAGKGSTFFQLYDKMFATLK
jgi:hypothetical protein